MFPEDIQNLARQVIETAAARGLVLVTAESCTGGLVAGALTAIAGSSAVLERGFVTYSNASKTDLLAVPADLIDACGAVSEPVARAMARGALAGSGADLSVSVTGVAGPGGGTAEKPVGLVFIGDAAYISNFDVPRRDNVDAGSNTSRGGIGASVARMGY